MAGVIGGSGGCKVGGGGVALTCGVRNEALGPSGAVCRLGPGHPGPHQDTRYIWSDEAPAPARRMRLSATASVEPVSLLGDSLAARLDRGDAAEREALTRSETAPLAESTGIQRCIQSLSEARMNLVLAAIGYAWETRKLLELEKSFRSVDVATAFRGEG